MGVDLQGFGCSALTIWKSGGQLGEAGVAFSRLEISEMDVGPISMPDGNIVGSKTKEPSVIVIGITVALGLKGKLPALTLVEAVTSVPCRVT
jgi:hypothetical protein